MKKKSLNKKLILRKQTIVKLTNRSMGYIIGGEDNESCVPDAHGPITKTDTDDPVKNSKSCESLCFPDEQVSLPC